MGKKSKRKPAKVDEAAAAAAIPPDPLTFRRLNGGCLHGGLAIGTARDVRLKAVERFRIAYTTNQPPAPQDRRYFNQTLIDQCLAEAAECALVFGPASQEMIISYMRSATGLNELVRNDKRRVNYSLELRNARSAGNIVVLAKLIPCTCLDEIAALVEKQRREKNKIVYADGTTNEDHMDPGGPPPLENID